MRQQHRNHPSAPEGEKSKLAKWLGRGELSGKKYTTVTKGAGFPPPTYFRNLGRNVKEGREKKKIGLSKPVRGPSKKKNHAHPLSSTRVLPIRRKAHTLELGKYRGGKGIAKRETMILRGRDEQLKARQSGTTLGQSTAHFTRLPNPARLAHLGGSKSIKGAVEGSSLDRQVREGEKRGGNAAGGTALSVTFLSISVIKRRVRDRKRMGRTVAQTSHKEKGGRR